MEKLSMFLLMFFSVIHSNAQNVGIGTTTPNATAKLDITSVNSGFLPPRMTYAQRNAIINPAKALIIFCIDCGNGEMQYYNGTNWMQMTVSPGSAPFSVPTVTTSGINAITGTTAVSGGNVTNDGGVLVTARGVCWSTNANPTIALGTKTLDGNGNGIFISSISGLSPNTTYHVRSYATNLKGTSYGGDSTFTTATNAVNLPSITICSQIWMQKNLNVSTYRNGDPIPMVTDPTVWAGLTTGAWCWYNNDSATYAATYGKLYNWYAVKDARGLAPQGWHVPTDAEWTTLSTCLGGDAVAGGKMKEQGTSHWQSPNTGADNSSGFAGLPAGGRNFNGVTDYFGSFGFWWSATEGNSAEAWVRYLYYLTANASRYSYYKTFGFSVRCVKD